MANLRVIAEIKPAGDFPVVDAPNVSVTGGKRLDVALSEAAAEVAKKANKSEVDAALAGKANKSEVDAAIENKADKSALEAINASVSVNTSNIQELSTESTVLSARMDTFTKLSEGSTTGDAELADGRVGADGKTYDNIGGAIRGQVTDLKSDLDNYAQVKKVSIIKPTVVVGVWSNTDQPYKPRFDESYTKTCTTRYKQDINNNFSYIVPSNFRVNIIYLDDSGYKVGRLTYYTSDFSGYVYPLEEAKNNNITNVTHYVINFLKFNGTSTTVDDITNVELENLKSNLVVKLNYTAADLAVYYGENKFKVDFSSGKAIRAHDGETSESSFLKCTDFIPTYGCNSITCPVPCYNVDTTFGFVFYDSNKSYIVGYKIRTRNENGVENRTFFAPTNAAYFRTNWWVDEETYGEFNYIRHNSSYIRKGTEAVIAASNSSILDKLQADFICTGTNDEITIQNAVNDGFSKITFAEGNYYIDSFPNEDANGCKSAVMIGKNDKQTNITFTGLGYGSARRIGTTNQFCRGAIFSVTNSCYNNCEANVNYSIFAAQCDNKGKRKYPFVKANFEHLAFIIPDNQKPITCIDGWMMSALSFYDIYAMAVKDTNNLKVPVEGCVGIRGLQGSNFGINNRWESAFVWGFYEGYAVSGEHVVGIDLGSRYCNYGFTFNKRPNTVGAWIHPITLINCCDECNFNMPYFGDNGESKKTDGLSGRQSINLIDFNLEWLPEYYAKGGNYATESNPGHTFGEISYTIQPSYSGNSKNSITIPFWAENSGANVATKNMAHSLSGNTETRNQYAANNNQQFFDTDLNKLIIYRNGSWVDTNGNAV